MSSSLIAFATVLVAAGVAHAGSPAAEVGKPAPPFSLNDVNGKTVALSDFKGKIVVLEWTNPNCPFVQRIYREGITTELQKRYTKQGVVWLCINSTNANHSDFEQPADLQKRYKEWNGAFTTLLMDADGNVGKMFDARTTPHMFIIDAKGVLAYNGAIDDDPRGGKTTKVNYAAGALDALACRHSCRHDLDAPVWV